MENWTHRDIFDIAWKHFAVIAEQRLKTFNFYVVLLAASVGAALTALEREANPYVIFVCGLFCIGSGISFLIIEIRSRRLLDIPKQVLTKLEVGDHWLDDYRLFSVDNLRQAGMWKKLISYSFAFRATMTVHIIFGIALLSIVFCPAINPNREMKNQNKSKELGLPIPTGEVLKLGDKSEEAS